MWEIETLGEELPNNKCPFFIRKIMLDYNDNIVTIDSCLHKEKKNDKSCNHRNCPLKKTSFLQNPFFKTMLSFF
ncbi:MAG: hypothetical protein ACOCQR_02330 [bacterium]